MCLSDSIDPQRGGNPIRTNSNGVWGKLEKEDLGVSAPKSAFLTDADPPDIATLQSRMLLPHHHHHRRGLFCLL